MGKGLDRFKRLCPPEQLAAVQRGLAGSEIVKTIMERQACTQGAAINSVFDLAAHGVIALLLQPNGEVLISTRGSDGLPDNPMMPEKLYDQIIVDTDVQRILNGKRPRAQEFEQVEQNRADRQKARRQGKLDS
jgi:hypothetical protein